MSATHEFFFELLAEEIPAWMLSERLSALRTGVMEATGSFAGSAPSDDQVLVDATSRRIIIRVAGIPDTQPDREQEIKGPPATVAFGSDGKPTKALDGFLRKNAAGLDDVETRDNYVWIRQRVRGKGAHEFFAETIPPMIENLRWPKMMSWGEGRSWIRPVHSIVALFDGSPVEMEIFGIRSGITTVGHRTRFDGTISVRGYDAYVDDLRKAKVIIDSNERIVELRRRSAELAAEVGGVPAEDELLWEQWRYLTEYPGVVRAEFRDEFLVLPPEVLTTVMRVHQKQLPIWKDGRLTHWFLAIIDGDADPDGYASNGNAFVSNARFADAHFFYQADRRTPLEDRMDQLAHLQFQERLGNYHQKTERIEAIALSICRKLGIDSTNSVYAARICKADLVTEMVKEFTDLQGVVGGIYAREEGKDDAVWQAVYDHYRPAAIDADLPRGIEGAIVSLADRIDTLCGFFSLGMIPSGSKDPFALRRAAQGVTQLLLNRAPWTLPLSIDFLIDLGFSPWNVTAETKSQLKDFCAERVRYVLETSKGYAYDEILAAMAARWSDSLTDLEDRVEALRQIRNSPDFLSVLDSSKRIANIVPAEFDGRLDPARLEHPTEKRLATLAALVEAQIDELSAQKQYRRALESFAGMAPELEKFFVDVMVMVDDETIRSNRMALLRKVGNVAGRIAAVTRIVIDRKELAAS